MIFPFKGYRNVGYLGATTSEVPDVPPVVPVNRAKLKAFLLYTSSVYEKPCVFLAINTRLMICYSCVPRKSRHQTRTPHNQLENYTL